MKKLLLPLCLGAASLLLPPPTAAANNLRVVAISTAPAPSAPGWFDLRADVLWDNSWRDAENWDAVWLFAKYRDRSQPGAGWRTATLATADTDHLVGSGLTLNAALDGKGVFVYRNAPGTGSTGGPATLRWNATADGVLPTAMQQYDVQVFGIEMVHIPQGAFNLNAAVSPALTNEFASVQGSLASITSEAPLPVGAIRWINDTGAGGTGNEVTLGTASYPGSAALGASYPKGFAAAYCMKYEVSQGQYTDFLNALTRLQQVRRVPVDISGDTPASGNVYVMAATDSAHRAFRSSITCPATAMGTTQPVPFSCARPDRAANYLIWADGAAYLDWAGLRPLSELEYEKVCRGPRPAVPLELAGGTISLAAVAADTISGPENGIEVLSSTTGPQPNYSFGFQTYVGGDGSNGPLRCGIFATATSTREQAGATYYGVLEMSGNCWERCVTVAEQDGGQPTNAGAFDLTQNGDGQLDATGEHNVPTWPNSTDVRGSNFRGGNWSRPAEWAAVSDRQYGGQAIAGRTSHRGIRGARSASTLSSPAHGTGGATTSLAKYHGGAFDGYGPSTTLVVGPTGLREDLTLGAIEAAPNPASGVITLHVREDAPVLTSGTLVLTDALGRPVRRLTNLRGAAVRVERAGLAPGVYFFRLPDGPRGPVAAGRLVWQ